jgi:hypothetical protein
MVWNSVPTAPAFASNGPPVCHGFAVYLDYGNIRA